MKRAFLIFRAVVLVVFCSFVQWGEAGAADSRVFVLCYHSFHGNNRFDYDISLEELASQMDFLSTKGFRFVSYADLVEGAVTGKKNVLVVIDDGNQSVYQAFHEVLKPRGIRPVLGIYPNIIGKKSYALTWDQLMELCREGCDIAGHGYYHLILNRKLYDSDRRAFVQEVALSKKVLEEKLGVKVSSFVYPNGARSDIAVQTLKDAGYESAFTIRWGQAAVPLALNQDPYGLPRFMILNNNWPMISGFILKSSAE